MTPPAEPQPSGTDRITVPLLFVAALLELALTGWPAAHAGDLAWAAGLFAGGLLPVVFRHPHRVLGFVPYALTALFVVATTALVWGWTAVAAGVSGAAAMCAVVATAEADGSGRFGRLSSGWIALAVGAFAGVGLAPLFLSGGGPERVSEWYTLAAGVAAGAVTLFAWARLLRPVTELTCEPLLWLMYKVRPAGPGLKQVPARGPCLVIANHACWFDPLLLAKVLPRPVTPMMTSRFYDLPVLRWVVRHVVRSIRVPEKAIKQDAPEIQEAIAALDRGECVLVFPEGFLRRSEEKPLKRFGRGVWQILKARPDTPVFACWIEGGWGSYTSYYNGRPTKNKKPDFRRPIGVGVSPVSVPADLLEDHLRTRLYLMNQVAAARTHLGLPELPLYELPERDEKEEEG